MLVVKSPIDFDGLLDDNILLPWVADAHKPFIKKENQV